MMKQIGVAVVCLMVVVLAVGCSNSSNSSGAISLQLSPQAAFVGSGQTAQFTATGGSGGVTWTVSGTGGGTVDANGNFTAPTVTQNTTSTITVTSTKDPSKTASATITIIAPGVVATTANAQVAQYTITVPDGLAAVVEFSTDTSYNLMTSPITAPTGGGAVTVLVAGMKGNTPYHMRAIFQPASGGDKVFADADHTFTTTAYPAASLPNLTTTTASGQTPQPGVELLSFTNAAAGGLQVAITDLAGNPLWGYRASSGVPAGDIVNPVKLLPNGHFLFMFGGVTPDGVNSVIQEVDLAGTVVWQMTAAQLNAALAAATCAGCNITVLGAHHDFAVLPNGHIVFIASTQQTVSGTLVTGDVLIDLDQNHNPVWLWNSFNSTLQVSRHPMSFPDWLHSNAVVYSPDDKALMLSMRHQAWVIKINYNDGAGDGSILWKLGYQGDFNLLPGTTNATDPQDWFNAQHDANIISTTTAGTLDVLLFDNGNQRVLQANPLVLCGASGVAACESRVPILHLDENAKTADITWIDKLAPVFSFFGGSARLLKNGNIEFDECSATPPPASSAAVFEVTKTMPPTTVWSMQIAGQNAYRAIRIPSLYPGVQW